MTQTELRAGVSVTEMAAGLEPWTDLVRLDESSTMRTQRFADRFSVVRVEATGPLPDAIQKSSDVPALLVSTFVRPVAAPDYRLWVDGKLIPTGGIPAFRANVIDLSAGPELWASRGDYVHFHVRRGVIEETAATLGYERVGGFRLSVADEDIVLAQITKSILPVLEDVRRASPLALDHLELIVGAHVVQRYGGVRLRRAVASGGLARWQRQRAMELLRENVDRRVRLAELAQECDLSVSHFARSFKASFGVTCHRWLTERRIERAQALLAGSNARLADIASQTGFSDQAAFTRTFHRIVGVTPSEWRREHGQRSATRNSKDESPGKKA